MNWLGPHVWDHPCPSWSSACYPIPHPEEQRTFIALWNRKHQTFLSNTVFGSYHALPWIVNCFCILCETSQPGNLFMTEISARSFFSSQWVLVKLFLVGSHRKDIPYMLTKGWLNTEVLPNANINCWQLFLSVLSKIQLFKNTKKKKSNLFCYHINSESEAKKWDNFWDNQARKMASILQSAYLPCLCKTLLGGGGIVNGNLLRFSIILITF